MSWFTARLEITNPTGGDYFEPLLSCGAPITRNKSLEAEMFLDDTYLLQFCLDISFHGRDHAGPRLNVNLLGWAFSLCIYDNRHWNYQDHCWENMG